MKRIFFSVGEPSGDLHGSNLIRQIRSMGQPVECVGFGGPKMKAAGLEQHYDLTQHAVMMLFTILKKLRFFFSLVDRAEEYFKNNQVDAVVLIDYPGFNWHIAKRAKRLGIPVFYYGVPQVWAWAPWRVRKIRKRVDHVLCKLPFEKQWFEDRGCQATYVGHPFFDQLESQAYNESFVTAFQRQSQSGSETWLDKFASEPANDQQELDRLDQGEQAVAFGESESPLRVHGRASVLLLLPGSRNREVRDNLPGMLRSAQVAQKHLPELRVAVGFFNQQQCDDAKAVAEEYDVDCEFYVDRTPELMKCADVCIACSGSVSLELMYHRLPTVIVYKIGRITRAMEKVLIRSRFITLVNMLRAEKISRDGIKTYNPDADNAEPVPMPEYLFSGDRSAHVARRIVHWLSDESHRLETVQQLDDLSREFAIAGASRRAANFIAAELGVQSDRQSAAA